MPFQMNNFQKRSFKNPVMSENISPSTHESQTLSGYMTLLDDSSEVSLLPLEAGENFMVSILDEERICCAGRQQEPFLSS